MQSDKFYIVISALQGLLGSDMVRSLSTSSHDVTDSFIDASSRAETLVVCRKAIQVLLQKAQNVQEVMEGQRELNILTQEYESHKSRAESLRKLSSLSIFTINLKEQEETEADYDSTPGFYPVLIAFKAMNDVLVAFKITLEIFTYFAVLVAIVFVPAYVSFWVYTSTLKKHQPNLG